MIRGASKLFLDAGIPDPDNDAALLLSHLTGRGALELRLDDSSDMDPAVISAYEDLVRKRLERIPLQYLLGETSFFGRLFRVDPRVLIPRPETELLCGLPCPKILDLCCGSGCIGLTLKAERPDSSVTLADLSSDALDVTMENAASLSLDVMIRQSDLLDDLSTLSFDMIVSNPPYIPSADCTRLQPEVLKEPLLALDGGSDGCDLYRRIAGSAGSVLKPGGKLLMEFGINESGLLFSLLQDSGFSDIRIRKDLAGIDRMILGVFP